MKLQMKFEDADFREMIFGFFDQRNFALNNLDELCDQFKQVFPNGLKASVVVKAAIEAAPIPEAVEEEATAGSPEVVAEVRKPRPARRRHLSAADLADPTIDTNVPSADDLRNEDLSEYDAVNEVPLDAIIKQSKELEQGQDV